MKACVVAIPLLIIHTDSKLAMRLKCDNNPPPHAECPMTVLSAAKHEEGDTLIADLVRDFVNSHLPLFHPLSSLEQL